MKVALKFVEQFVYHLPRPKFVAVQAGVSGPLIIYASSQPPSQAAKAGEFRAQQVGGRV